MADPQQPDFIPATPAEQSYVPGRAQAGQPDFIPAQPHEQHWYDTAVHELGELNTGFTTALTQTGRTAEQAINAIPVVGPAFQRATAAAQAADVARAQTPMNTPGRMAGNAIENILEFAAGEEALKGASFLTKMEVLRPIADALKKSPIAVQVLANMTGQAARVGTMSGAQRAVHGGTPEEIRHAAELGAVGGAVTEPLTMGARAIIDAVRPGEVEALGEQLPALASQRPGAAPVAKNIAHITTEPETAAAQQLGSQRALINRAQEVTERELENLNAARQARWRAGEREINLAPETPTPTRPQLTAGQPQLPEATATGAPQIEAGQPETGLTRTNQVGPFEGEFPPQPGQTAPRATTNGAGGAATPRPRVQYIEEGPPNFQPIDARAEAQKVLSFGDAAEKIREHAAPVFAAFDEASGGEYTRLRALRDAAYEAQDYRGVADAEKQIDALFDTPNVKDRLDRLDYKTVKSAWRTSKMLDGIHNAIRRGFNVEDAGLAEDAGVWRGINGGRLQTGINRLTNQYTVAELNQVLGRGGMEGLQRIASLLQTPRYAQQYGQVIGDVADDIAGTLATKGGGPIPQTLNWARKLVLHRVATDPNYARMVEYAVKNRIPQRTAVALLVAALNSTQNRQTIQNTQVVAPQPARGVQGVTLPTITPERQRQRDLTTAAGMNQGEDTTPDEEEP